MTTVSFFHIFFMWSMDNCSGNSITELVKHTSIIGIQFTYIGCFFRGDIQLIQDLRDV